MADPSAAVAGTGGTSWLRVLLWAILILFAFFYLAPLYVMIATSLKSVEEIRTGNLLALPSGSDLRCLGQGLVVGLRGRGVHRDRPLLLQLGEDGHPGRAALDHDRRAQRLRPDQMDVPRGQCDLRADPVRLLHPVPDRADPDGPHTRCPGLGLEHARFGAGPCGVRYLLHHALLPQLLRRVPDRPGQGGQDRRCRLLHHLLARSCCRTRCRSWW